MNEGMTMIAEANVGGSYLTSFMSHHLAVNVFFIESGLVIKLQFNQ